MYVLHVCSTDQLSPNPSPPPIPNPSPSLQLFYHHNIVQQLKTLYDEILRPELLEDHPPPGTGDTAPGHTSTPTGRGKREKEREKGGSGGKDRKGKPTKEEVHKESIPEMPGQTSSVRIRAKATRFFGGVATPSAHLLE